MTLLAPVPTRVVVPVDDSYESRRALPFAQELAVEFGADVETVTVADPEILTTAAVTLDGDTVAALCDHVRDREVIVCMASHGRSGLGRRLIGSTAEAFLRASPVPVIVVGPDAEPQTSVGPRTIVAGVAWPPGPDRLLELLAVWAPVMHAAIELVHVANPSAAELYVGKTTGRRGSHRPDLSMCAARLRDAALLVDAHEVIGRDPSRALLDIASRVGARVMLAVESHHGATRSHHDVGYQLIRHGPYPVLATTGTEGLEIS